MMDAETGQYMKVAIAGSFCKVLIVVSSWLLVTQSASSYGTKPYATLYIRYVCGNCTICTNVSHAPLMVTDICFGNIIFLVYERKSEFI